MRVFVVGGYVPNGGTYMAYHLAHLLSRDLGLDASIVRVGAEVPNAGVFQYPSMLPMIDLQSFEQSVGERDLVIANPSFSDRMFGLRLPGKKLMYVQGFTTFPVIDGFFHHYVGVSRFVSEFLRSVYAIDAPVIPAFIRTDLIPSPNPWQEREPRRILAVGKLYFPEFLQLLSRMLKERHPLAEVEFVQLPRVPHAEVLQWMNDSRYVVGLSACEGFGLLPLEAMGCGCTYVGFDGVGGRDFMVPGYNCETTCYPDFSGLADRIAALLAEPDRARKLAEHAAQDAKRFDYAHFRERWLRYFRDKLNLESRNLNDV